MFKTSSLLPFVAALTFTSVALAGTYSVIQKPPPVVRFVAKGPGGLKIEGKGDSLTVKDDGKTLTLKASVKNLKTGIGLRDNHCRKYIGAEDHPEAKLVVDKSALKVPDDKKKTSGSATGKFTLKGVTKDTKFDYTAERHGSHLVVTGDAKIDIRDFNIEKPCYLGVCTDTDVRISVNFKLEEK